MLDICLLGTGGMMPLPYRWLTSLLLRYKGRMILIDCGEGTQIPVKMAEWGFKTIDVILFTHYHADHIAGLPGLLLTLGNSGREEPLTLMGPPGIKKVVEGLTVISPELPFEMNLIELSDNKEEEKEIGEFNIKSIPVDHTLTCLAYSVEIKRPGKFQVELAKQLNIPLKYWSFLQKGETVEFEDQIITPDMVLGSPRRGLKISYSTDTRPCDDLVNFVMDSDVLICEGMYGDEEDQIKAVNKKHMTFKEAALIAQASQSKELWLTHYSPSLKDPQEYLDSIKPIFGNVIAGSDLLKTTVTYQD